MTEYTPDDHHGHDHDATPHVDLPDHHPDDSYSAPHLPPLDDLGTAHAPLPDDLHFPGDPAHDAPVHADADPAAPFPDDDGFADWLSSPAHAPQADGGGSDTDLREQLAGPPPDADGLPSSESLVDWTLRNLGDA